MTGLFFGSFNPVHNGHLQIASYILKKELCEDLFFILSPQNPFKQNTDLLEDKKRLEILEAALSGEPHMQVCGIEMEMPRPSYTVDTLSKLAGQYPSRKFALIIGADNLPFFHLWKDYRSILEHWPVFVYPRPGIDIATFSHPGMIPVDAPLFPVSSTDIRQKIREGEEIATLVPSPALALILQYYKTTK